MTNSRAFLSSVLLALLLPAGSNGQARIEGQVVNGTSRRPVSSQEVRLLSPKEGMQQVATASTDVQGRFTFAPGALDPSAFFLVETRFAGVAYHAPVQFDSSGSANVSLTVYEAVRSMPVRVQSLRALVRAQGAKAEVREELELLNSSDPPRAYASPDGTFRFRLSPGASQPNVAVEGLMNMPLPQTPARGKSPGEYFIRYPLKPGLTRVELSYELDYSAAHLELGDRISYPIDQAELYVFPSRLSVESSVFEAAGVDAAHNVQKLEARNLKGDAPLEVRVSGEAAEEAEAEAAGAEVKVVPNSMTRLGAPLLACFLLVLLWALGVRVAKEWPQWQARRGSSPERKQLGAKVDTLVNSLADLDELFAAGKVGEKQYWKERLELKARLVAILKKAPASLLESYATRNTAR